MFHGTLDYTALVQGRREQGEGGAWPRRPLVYMALDCRLLGPTPCMNSFFSAHCFLRPFFFRRRIFCLVGPNGAGRTT